MSSAYKKDLAKVIKRAEEQGWTIRYSRNGHPIFVPPTKDAPMVVTSGTPSDHRTWKNFLAQMKRSGYKP